nr:hypothetical protein [Armatimonadota bacterium]
YQLNTSDGGENDWYNSYASDSFDTWVMYRPPSVGNQGTVYVPLQTLTWRWGGNASRSQGAWAVNEAPPFSKGTPRDTSTPPAWNLTIPFQFTIGP